MEFSAEMIASFLEGEIIGDKNVIVNSIAKIEEAHNGDLAFLANPKYEQYIYNTEASIVLVNRTFVAKGDINATLILVDDSYKSFASLLELYVANKPQKSGISPLASISPKAKIGENVFVGAYAVIEDGVTIGDNVKIYPQTYIGDNVKIGEESILYAGVKIYEECVIGNRVILHSGCVVGADGFGFAPTEDGSYNKIPQIGNVIIEDDVELGANTCVDRATMGSTIIKKGVKLDNLVQIAHNVVIGENTVAAAQLGVAGSTKVGANCIFGGQVGIIGHLEIADGTQVSSKSGIMKSSKTPNEVLMGLPAFNAGESRRSTIIYRNLPSMMNDIKALKKEIAELKANSKN